VKGFRLAGVAAGSRPVLDRHRSTAVVALGMAGLLAVAGCTSPASPEGTAAPGQAVGESPGPAVSAARVVVSPANAAKGVTPDTKVTVRVGGGKLTRVRLVDGRGRVIKGKLAADARTWTSTSALQLSRTYRATVEAQDAAGVASTSTAKFSTVKPAEILTTSISPLSGSTVGVGMPIVVKFNAAVHDRAAVEERLKVTSSKPADGAWHWYSDTEVHYRPKAYWPAYTDIKLDVDLAGVDAGDDVWGDKSRAVEFSTGASQVSVVDVKALKMTVKRDGKVVRTFPVTTGKDGFRTRGGIKVISEKYERKVMDASTIGISPGDPEYYRLDVPYALRVTWSGEFVHAAEWSEGRQGVDNVSHGCVGMSMANGKWFFEQSRVGDVIQVVNSSRELESGNGWTDWNVSWEDWKAGSALV
jgi:lipoprotein-anchoring transpeptidase ErfK/SrfK